ncbi:MAG: HAMP domain-containing histidine kinase [Bacteroidia bacterium]|nr:HAMP domain-containing histidine kinase [Bacteroidia bacterium]
MLGWVWVLLPVWESWTAPQGRWGAYAFPLISPEGRVYVIDGRRVWRLNTQGWEERLRLPEEVRAGLALGGDTLLLGGMNRVYWAAGESLSSVAFSGTGWIYRMWYGATGIALRGVQASLWAERQGERWTFSETPGEWMGVSGRGLLWRAGDSLWLWPANTPLPVPSGRWIEGFSHTHLLWLINDKGEVWAFPQGRRVRMGARAWVGPYLLTETSVIEWPSQKPVWQGSEPVYAAAWEASLSLLCVLTPSECVALYVQAPIHWVRRWPVPVTQGRIEAGQWVFWQGETAIFPEGTRRYAATLLEATRYKGQWLWATPVGILDEAGRPFLAPGRYVGAIAARGTTLAWATGMEVVIQQDQKSLRYRFPQPIRKLGWQGANLWAWRAESFYTWDGRQWKSYKLPFLPEEVVSEGEGVFFRVGRSWLRWEKGRVRDTLSALPGRDKLPPLSLAWGRVLGTYTQAGEVRIFTSLGELVYKPGAGKLPPLHLSARLMGPALRSLSASRFELPTERPYVELSWTAVVPFLPSQATVWVQIGEEAPRRLTQPSLVLALSRPGRVPLRVLLRHPWYPAGVSVSWEVEVRPPWYESWPARLAFLVGALALVMGIWAVREWNHRRLARRLQAERQALLRQVESQQVQLLQSERMANLGLMAAHIAHEINTPLGVIQSALSEMEEKLRRLRPEMPLPLEARPGPEQLRALRQAWQAAHPELPPPQIQRLALLGYTPEQWPAIAHYLTDEATFSVWEQWLLFGQALGRAKEAAEKLYGRVQAIRMYVRGMEAAPTEKVLLQENLQKAIAFYKPLLRRVQVHFEAPPDPLWINAHPARLDQVWANLIQNAIQAMPDGGELFIKVRVAGEKVEILFQDTGKGVPPSLREAIFEPLFTTKAPGEGTGLGLPLCRQIVEGYGGQIRLLHSEPGYTLFAVELPLASE